jgi:hypothetical protein
MSAISHATSDTLCSCCLVSRISCSSQLMFRRLWLTFHDIGSLPSNQSPRLSSALAARLSFADLAMRHPVHTYQTVTE